MTKLSQQLNKEASTKSESEQANGFIEKSPIYVPSYPAEVSSSQSSAAPVYVPSFTADVSTTQPKPAPTPGTSSQSPCLSNGGPPVRPEEEPRPDEEIELKQDITVSDHKVVPRRASSPFSNGRTEVLIGQDAVCGDTRVKTTAIVENHRPPVTEDSATRHRRRSGSSIVVGGQEDQDPVKVPPEETDDAYNMMMMMAACDNGPHREMAVDVPESFIARNKTPPRYPPPRPQARIHANVNGTSTGNSVAKPVPPPRDHLRIEKDGRLVNRAPAPQVPARSPGPTHLNNNHHTLADNNVKEAPTSAELSSIRKFQEVKRKERVDKERIAQQNEFLNRSLRGSKKLRALESGPVPSTGVVNDAYMEDDLHSSSKVSDEDEESLADTLHKVISYRELVASLQRLSLQLKKFGLNAGQGFSSLEVKIGVVQTLLLSPEFGRALAIHNKVQQSWPQHESVLPVTAYSQTLVRDCLEAIQPIKLSESIELADLLTRFEFEGLIYAHDMISRDLSPDRGSMTTPETETSMPNHSPVHDTEDDDSNIKIIKIEKTNEPLGATVRNEGEAVIIGRVVRGGAAEKSGLLHEGDEVLEVNGIEMRGKSVNDVCDLLSGMTGTLTFLIVPGQNRGVRPHHNPARDNLMHMKAHFDYDPEDDLYIPCRELGISFTKGDVLHVICQEDPNWWQAYREGEEDQTLAGLIPSRSFQHQRESMKQTITGDKINKEKSKKSSTFLCAKKNPKKKKKKPYVSYNDGGYPIYSTNTVDDYEVEEIVTYEEVALYYPRANHKRPIVLIGPPNIGRHELRQRLMEDTERFAAAIPHTSRSRKDGEVDGQDYHFITRAQFEADILSRKFVEHGEYERAYYGTSLDAIRSVVNAGKICVLNLHPQSLKILRGSDLKPYVVFVAPPSLEKLRQKKIRNGEAYKEEELKDIIEKAREMEDKYGHLFDLIIINNDTERTYHQLLTEINSLEREPQWVPASWVKTV
uniref:MAGUK p55 subfamily member 5 n=1 Tax=Clastoptera arizonana TaxID=38151 RepID=A0A1B6C910_9HEMI